MNVLLDKEYGKLEYNSEKHFLKLTLLGDITDEDYKYIWEFSLEQSKKTKCGNVLFDQQNVGFIKMRSRAWFILKWLPKFNQKLTGVEKKLAILPSKHIAHQTGLNYILAGLKKIIGHSFETFESEEEAILWLSANKKEQEVENKV
jgi:hypothetical protein